jgi:hypothetical protein
MLEKLCQALRLYTLAPNYASSSASKLFRIRWLPSGAALGFNKDEKMTLLSDVQCAFNEGVNYLVPLSVMRSTALEDVQLGIEGSRISNRRVGQLPMNVDLKFCGEFQDPPSKARRTSNETSSLL